MSHYFARPDRPSLLGLLLAAVVIGGGCAAPDNDTSAEPESQQRGVRTFDEYRVSFGFANSASLPAEIRQQYEFLEDDAAVLTVSVSDKAGNNGIPASVSGKAVNLSDQLIELEFAEFMVNGYVSYAATVELDTRTTYTITLEILPETSNETLEIEFRDTEAPDARL